MNTLIIIAVLASGFAGPTHQQFAMPLPFPSRALCETFRTSDDFQSAVTDLYEELHAPAQITAECKK